MKKLLFTILLSLGIFIINAQTIYFNKKDRIIDSLKIVIKTLETKNNDIYKELINCQYELNKLKNNNYELKLPYGTEKLSEPIPFEDIKNIKFKVFQTLDGGSLARKNNWGIIVVLVGNYYNGQIIEIKEPMVIGHYTYTSFDNNGHEIVNTFPVILPKEQYKE